MSQVVESPQKEQGTVAAPPDIWHVTVYDNDHNSYEEVITVLMIATGCDLEEAKIEAWEIDHLGQCVVHRAAEDECRSAADIIAQIGIRVEVEPEP